MSISPQRNPEGAISLEDAHAVLTMALSELRGWETSLGNTAERLPVPELAAEIEELLARLRGLNQQLETAAGWIENPSTWEGPPTRH